MTLFELLRARAKTHEGIIVSRSSRRLVSWRKFWSRIERGTARLQGEWGVTRGDTVAYWGLGHQDALMLYIATARCGARLLPLEHASLQQASATILRDIPVKILLHDDELSFAQPPAAPIITNLSSLIATRSFHAPVVTEDVLLPSLITLFRDANGRFRTEEHSLQQLSLMTSPPVAQEFKVGAALFDNDVFAPQVLSTLTVGGTIIFR